MSKKFKKALAFYYSSWFPFAVFAIVVLLIHLLAGAFADDIFFSNALQKYPSSSFFSSLTEYLSTRYFTWTSRLIIEIFEVVFCMAPMWIWKILDTALFVSVGVLISKIFWKDKGHARTFHILLLSCVLTFSFLSMSSAGWIATTVNYLWPFAFGLIAIYGTKKVLIDQKPISNLSYIGYTLALIIASNAEQMCFILLAVYIGFCIYAFLSKRKNIYPYIQLLLIAAMLIFILTCSGNALRGEAETLTWFPDYASFSFLYKIQLGISSALKAFLVDSNMLFFIFTILLASAVWLKNKKQACRLISAIPAVYCLSLFAMQLTAQNNSGSWPAKFLANMNQYGLFHPDNYSKPEPYIWLICMMTVCAAILFSMFVLFDGTKKALLPIGILTLGFLTQASLGFSPTIWASFARTSFYFNMSFVIAAALVMKQWDFENKTATHAIMTLFCSTAFIQTFVAMFTVTY